MAEARQIETESMGVICGGYRNSRGRRRGQIQGKGQLRGGGNAGERKCYNCDKPGFTKDHMNKCAAKRATCYFCKKLGHFEWTCRAKRNNRRRQSIGIIQGQKDHYQYDQADMDEKICLNKKESSVGWVNTPPPKH